MKRITLFYKYLMILVPAFVFMPVDAFSQTSFQRVTLVEKMSSASCPNCAKANKYFVPQMLSYGNKVAFITYPYDDSFHHDPMGIVAKDIVQGRMADFYGIRSFPYVTVNGKIIGHPSNVDDKYIDEENARPSYVGIEAIVNKFSENDVRIDVTLSTLKDFQSEDIRLFAAVIEQDIRYDSPPGSNGETEFNNIIRTILTDVNGMKLGKLEKGKFETVSLRGSLNGSVENISGAAIVVYVQDHSTKEVYQAVQFDPGTAGIEETGLAGVNSVNLYPAQAESDITFEFELERPEQLAVQIYNTNGMLVKEVAVRNYLSGYQNERISLDSLPQGSYILALKGKKGLISRKFIKMR